MQHKCALCQRISQFSQVFLSRFQAGEVNLRIFWRRVSPNLSRRYAPPPPQLQLAQARLADLRSLGPRKKTANAKIEIGTFSRLGVTLKQVVPGPASTVSVALETENLCNVLKIPKSRQSICCYCRLFLKLHKNIESYIDKPW